MGQDWPQSGTPPPLPPGGGAGGGGGSTPWERRQQIGFVNALVETSKEVITAPTEFFRRMPTSGGIGAPLGYGVIVGYLGLVAQALYQAVFQTIAGGTPGIFGGGRPELQRLLAMMEGGIGFVLQVVLGPVLLVMGMFISGGIYHLMLMLLDGARKDFEATFRVASYSQAAALFGIIPFCGGVIGFVYQIVLWIIGLSEAHGIGKGKAAAAVLIPILLLCCCCIGGIAMLAGGLAAALGQR